eukprot:TRINITY_DN19363_c0_g1_i1.p1 TRINITY_DN19363_c0_g1~~TRINITY_DN19363_c0_g1_i1.p1  ORF type:complete len:627 (+),score=121.55 TRINITY_DN19363_c0_g1_i1:129-2009(+)
MIHYAPGYWNIKFAFALRGSVFPKAFVWAAFNSTLAVCAHLYLQHQPGLADKLGAGDVGASILGGFTFILGFLVVFRSQQAYSRWWEGGTLMQQLRGEWFNAASCLFAFCNSEPGQADQVRVFKHQLVRLVSLLYASAIQQVADMDTKQFELIDISGFSRESIEFLQSDDCHDNCEVVLQWIQRLIVTADEKKIVKIAPPILSRVYNQLGNGIVELNNARKISEFPIPFPLAQMITVMLLFHWLITPLICATTVGSSHWAGFLCFVVTFSYWSINYIATELEMPFGDDLNDLPLHDMQSDLNASLTTLLQPLAGQCPHFHYEPVHDYLKAMYVDFDKNLFEECTPEKTLKEVFKNRELSEKRSPVPLSKARLNRSTSRMLLGTGFTDTFSDCSSGEHKDEETGGENPEVVQVKAEVNKEKDHETVVEIKQERVKRDEPCVGSAPASGLEYDEAAAADTTSRNSTTYSDSSALRPMMENGEKRMIQLPAHLPSPSSPSTVKKVPDLADWADAPVRQDSNEQFGAPMSPTRLFADAFVDRSSCGSATGSTLPGAIIDGTLQLRSGQTTPSIKFVDEQRRCYRPLTPGSPGSPGVSKVVSLPPPPGASRNVNMMAMMPREEQHILLTNE